MKKFCPRGLAARTRIATAASSANQLRLGVVALFVILLSLLVAPRAHAQGLAAGAADTRFGSPHAFTAVGEVLHAPTIQSDGEVLIGGGLTQYNGVSRTTVPVPRAFLFVHQVFLEGRSLDAVGHRSASGGLPTVSVPPAVHSSPARRAQRIIRRAMSPERGMP